MKSEAWSRACELTERYLREPVRADRLFAKIPFSGVSAERRNCQFLFYGVVRNRLWLEHLLGGCLSRRPRPLVYAALCVGLFELLSADDDGRRARIVHSVVDGVRSLATAAEARMANAVLRRLLRSWDGCTAIPPEPAGWALRFSHPDWLVKRWLATHGERDVLELLRWNQASPAVYIVFPGAATERGGDQDQDLAATGWPGFYRWRGSDWGVLIPMIESGECWVQDPSTRHAVEVLFEGHCGSGDFLDLCAAPGGKTRAIAARLAAGGRLVSVDLPGPRFRQLEDSVKWCAQGDRVRTLAADVRTVDGAALAAAGLPTDYDAVLIDVPCSNTGVLQRRPEVKDRLTTDNLQQLVALQRLLLAAAANRVRPGGRLVYSSCSIEAEENSEQVQWFLAQRPDFTLQRAVESFPVRDGHDGGGAYLLVRSYEGSP